MDENQHHDQFDQVVDKLEAATNILVTVKSSPNIDQLSALIGLTLTLNKIGKHATAVFSGDVPPVLEFLKPDDTIETDTNSLRDFIIAIDKSKADKLRYKVEGDVVRIFITPYRTSLSGDDLEFSQGDFNVDAIVGLGVHDKSDLDKAITAHGKILHDATVISITSDRRSELGNVLWVDDKASSLSEMVADVAHELDKNIFDEQIATAFLTGIVAETHRFSNEKTNPHAMSIAGVLMAGGANAQLISTKLDEEEKPKPKNDTKKSRDEDRDDSDSPPQAPEQQEIEEDGTLSIEHSVEEESQPKTKKGQAPDDSLPEIQEEDTSEENTGADLDEKEKDEIHIDEHGKLHKLDDLKLADVKDRSAASSIITEPPTFSGKLTANADSQNVLEPTTDPMSSPAAAAERPIMSRKEPSSALPVNTPLKAKTIHPPLEADSRANVQPASPSLDELREKVSQASLDAPINQNKPAAAIGATPIDLGSQPIASTLSPSQPSQPEPLSPGQEPSQPSPLSPGQAPTLADPLAPAQSSQPAPLSPGQAISQPGPVSPDQLGASPVSPVSPIAPNSPPPPVPPPMMPS